MTSRLTRLHGRLLHVNLDACTVHLFSADLAHLPPRIFVRKMRFRCLVAGSFSETVRPQREAVDDLNKRKTVRHTMTWSRSHDRHCRRPALCLALCWRRKCRAAARATSASSVRVRAHFSRGYDVAPHGIGDALQDSAFGCPWCPTSESRRACSLRSCTHLHAVHDRRSLAT